MKKILLATLIFIAGHCIGQHTINIYQPREIQRAFKNESRNINGRPGNNYFQNISDYTIDAEFFPEINLIKGNETISYANNSPDTLKYLVFNVFQNYFKQGEARDDAIDSQNIHDGVQIQNLIVNEDVYDVSALFFTSTLMYVKLQTPIAPEALAIIKLKWENSLPKTGMYRQGTYFSDSYFVACWFPRIAVYDDISGWNTNGFKGKAEFYHEYGEYNVSITVPSDYLIWSSGELQNPEDIFQEEYLKKIKLASVSDSIVNIIRAADWEKNQITQKSDKLTWHFSVDDIPDFAFAVSKSYFWDGVSAGVGSRRVMINSVFHPSSENFRQVAEISKKSVQMLSQDIFGIPYPYNQLTVFNGEKNGMEFPGMVNDREESSYEGSVFITTHEIAHTYFPFNVGFNEQKYSWMDEGLVGLLSVLMFSEIIGDTTDAFFNVLAEKYVQQASKMGVDIPLMAGSHNATDFTYGFMTYERPITAFYLLYDYLGEEIFFNLLTSFSECWKQKHPTPYDLFFFTNNFIGEDLEWFWEPWFFQFGYADLSIESVNVDGNIATVCITNKGGFPVPIALKAQYADGSERYLREEMSLWKGRSDVEITIECNGLQRIVLGQANIPDVFPEDNDWGIR